MGDLGPYEIRARALGLAVTLSSSMSLTQAEILDTAGEFERFILGPRLITGADLNAEPVTLEPTETVESVWGPRCACGHLEGLHAVLTGCGVELAKGRLCDCIGYRPPAAVVPEQRTVKCTCRKGPTGHQHRSTGPCTALGCYCRVAP